LNWKLQANLSSILTTGGTTLPIIVYLAHFVAGALLANGVPHFVNGVCGRPFRTPFVRLRMPKSVRQPPMSSWAGSTG
jgi:hypothetical protein